MSASRLLGEVLISIMPTPPCLTTWLFSTRAFSPRSADDDLAANARAVERAREAERDEAAVLAREGDRRRQHHRVGGDAAVVDGHAFGKRYTGREDHRSLVKTVVSRRADSRDPGAVVGDRARTPSSSRCPNRLTNTPASAGSKIELDGIDEAVLRTADRKIDDIHAVADRLIDRRHAVGRRASGDRVIRKTPDCLVNGRPTPRAPCR